MDPTRPSWRVLDDEEFARPFTDRTTTVGQAPSGSPAPRTGSGPAPSWRLMLAALALALGLGGVALLIVASGPAPVAVVEAGTERVAAVEAGSGPSSDADRTHGMSRALVVHVAGAVRRPGLVTLGDGARVADAIEAAGGLDVRADPTRVGLELNLAEHVTDGQRIVVPSRDDPSAGAGDGSSGDPAGGATNGGQATGGPTDLNRADAAALDALPGVGPATVAKIVAARQERPFRTVDELVERKVLGAAALARIRDLVVVR